ncbi:3313_t:CDS:2, partial [Dentiscutata heterogama]
MEVKTWPDSNIQPFILVTHDECIFSANNRSQSLWIPNGEQPLQKKACFPECQALFVFNNATSYAIFSLDALIANHMNLGPARKQKILHSILYFCKGIRHDQDMIFSSDYYTLELRREAKGLREVLRGRGLWSEKELKLKE